MSDPRANPLFDRILFVILFVAVLGIFTILYSANHFHSYYQKKDHIAKALKPDTLIQRIGFGSCASQTRLQPIWDAVLKSDPQLFIMMGDNVYGDVTSSKMWELERAYKTLATHPDFSKARREIPMLAIWDDHDYGVNDGGADFVYREPAEKLFRDFWKFRDGPKPGHGLYHSRIYGPKGKRVQIILLDTRSFRSALTKKSEATRLYRGYIADRTADKTMLGEEQWTWLEGELKREADLRVIVSSIQVLAQGHHFERWDALSLERERLLNLVKETNAKGVIFLSGDRHRGAVYKLEKDMPYPIYEVTSSSLNRPFADPKETGPHQLQPTYGQENYGMLQIDWLRQDVLLELRGLKGDVVQQIKVPFKEIM